MRLIIFGAGGHARVACQVAERGGAFDEIVFSCYEKHSGQMMGREVLDQGAALNRADASQDVAFVAVGDNVARRELTYRVMSAGFPLATLVDPSASVSEYAVLSAGTIVCPQAVVNPCAHLGIGCIVNTAAVVEHDCELGDFVHLSPHAVLGGGARVGELSWLGVGSCVIDHIEIGSGVTVGAGACVIEATAAPGTYVGVPAKRLTEPHISAD